MNLCIDIGNTRAKFALFNKKAELKKLVVSKDIHKKQLHQIIEKYAVRDVIISSVRKGAKKIKKQIAEQVRNCLVLSSKTKMAITNTYQTPKTLGRDRIAAVVGARGLFPDHNILVIDAGTCITYDFIDIEGRYLGGSILPGVDMRYKAMHQQTAKLPLVNRKKKFDTFIGYNTKTSMQTGVQLGTIYEMDGFIDNYQSHYENLKVVITGGDSSYFETQLKNEIFAVPNLVLLGLNQILRYNVKQKK